MRTVFFVAGLAALLTAAAALGVASYALVHSDDAAASALVLCGLLCGGLGLSFLLIPYTH